MTDHTSSDVHAHSGAANLLDSQTTHLDDILTEKLERAFHKQTSKFSLNELAQVAAEHSPVDLAYAAPRLPPSVRPVLYHNLASIEGKIEFLINTDCNTRAEVLRNIPDEEMKTLVEKMPSDDAMSVLDDVSERRFRRVVDLIDTKKAHRIRELKKQQQNTAGRMMTNEFFAFQTEVTIGEAAGHIRNNPGIDLTRCVFVLDSFGFLQGYVPARNLIVNPSHLALRQVMRPVPHKVTPDLSREEVVELVERYKIAAMPVVNDEGYLVGVVTYEDVLEAVEDIADETLARMAGTAEKVSDHEPVKKRFIARAPWLCVTLLAGLLNMCVMSSFQRHEGAVLTFVFFFVPLVTGMSGNIGIQSSTILVRSMATGLITRGNRWEAMLKEIAIGMLSAVIFAMVCGLLIVTLYGIGWVDVSINPWLAGLFVGLGLFGACISGTFLGVYFPLLFAKFGVDPAIASGPIITAVNDFVSMSIYFLIAMGLSVLFFA